MSVSLSISISLSHTHTHTHTLSHTHRAAAVEQLVALLTHSVPGGEEAERMREKIKWGEDEYVIGRRVYVSVDD